MILIFEKAARNRNEMKQNEQQTSERVVNLRLSISQAPRPRRRAQRLRALRLQLVS
jgi:hypothetical protein